MISFVFSNVNIYIYIKYSADKWKALAMDTTNKLERAREKERKRAVVVFARSTGGMNTMSRARERETRGIPLRSWGQRIVFAYIRIHPCIKRSSSTDTRYAGARRSTRERERERQRADRDRHPRWQADEPRLMLFRLSTP